VYTLYTMYTMNSTYGKEGRKKAAELAGAQHTCNTEMMLSVNVMSSPVKMFKLQ
jgi:hypothetical protein